MDGAEANTPAPPTPEVVVPEALGTYVIFEDDTEGRLLRTYPLEGGAYEDAERAHQTAAFFRTQSDGVFLVFERVESGAGQACSGWEQHV